ncbi:MAG TPA: hypothetical protein VGR41_01910 [Actinomycetota bacterium]|nr:hypothetical protein [Actinomycetota bacterium]
MDATPISLVRDPLDPVAGRPAVGWAIDQLRGALEAKGSEVALLDREPADERPDAMLLVAGATSAPTERFLARAGISVPAVPEALGLVPERSDDRPVLLACGSDERGLVYAVLELADRVGHAEDPRGALQIEAPIVERPANAVRSVARLFASEIDDKPWFHDEDFWRRYLSMVAAQRFNRFNLMVGLGYNFPWHVTDGYLYFAYPFLVDVPGYRVRVPQLPDEERDRNLEMLRFVSEEAVARGLDFQFGMWTHAFELFDSPDARHTIEGLTPENHAAYCRDALQALLEACPAIGGLTIRTHGESGIPERSWDFWKVVLDGAVRSGRRVGLDLHAKGLDRETLDIALATGLPVTVSPKFSAEHMGLPYHQAAMRELDRPPAEDEERGRRGKGRFMTVSEGSRPFTRYSYGDFLREDREYDVVFRIWPGTQRLLLWGDPAMAAGFGRNAGLAGSQGLEWCDPLSLKGREGSGMPGSRDGYADPSLSPADDWEKHEYTYGLFGRLTYNPDAEPETWRRHLRGVLGPAATPAEAALASASRILPLVTSAHHPSASNNYYWPEVYTDIAIVGRHGSVETHYYDTPVPKRFGTVGPLDPEIFLSVEESVRELLGDERSGRSSALEVAGWLERLSEDAAEHLARLEKELPDRAPVGARRLIVDVAIQSAIGRFFAGKLRAAVLYETYTQTGGPALLRDALEAYRAARAAWAEAVERACGVYVDDLTFGPQAYLRGTWADRLPAIDRDLEAMTAIEPVPFRRTDGQEADLRRIIAEAGARSGSRAVAVTHTPPPAFRRGEPIIVAIDVGGGAGSRSVAAVHVRYRHLDQSEIYAQVEMTVENDRFVASIPGEDTDSPYALQYLFVIRDRGGDAWLHPGLGAELSHQPYFVVRPRSDVTFAE